MALALCALSCLEVASAGIGPHSLRGHHLRHHGHRHVHHAVSHVQVPPSRDARSQARNNLRLELERDLAEKKHELLKVGESMAPLYDDFLDIMNHAVDQALQEQRAIPAYDDFLHLLKGGAEKAYKEQKQSGTPSYEDFLHALKASSSEATKTPVPSYEEFLHVLKTGAEKAMQRRMQKQEVVNDDIVLKRENPLENIGSGVASGVSANPLGKIQKDVDDKIDKTTKQLEGKKSEDDDALKRELKELQEKKRKSGTPGKAPKQLMSRINVLRTQLCWQRPKLWEHEKCLRFLGIHCLKESTGEGICRDFAKQSKQRCDDPNSDPEWREDYCALAEALGDNYDVEDEEKAGEEKQETTDQAAGESPEAIKAEDGEEEEVVEAGSEEGSEEELEDDDDEFDDLDDELASDDDENKNAKDKDGKGSKSNQAGSDEGAAGEGEGGEGSAAATAADGAAGAIDPNVNDQDGDGVVDAKDAFPDDPNEWHDTDGDGIGDNSDHDLDGDGTDNDVDAFPHDPKEWKDSDMDGIGDNADKDRDNDGIPDDKDKFPDDPSEWQDSDGDGVGDNRDAYPYNPNCHHPVEPCEDANPATPKPGSAQDPGSLDMDSQRPIGDQGYSEHSSGPPVFHENYYSWVGDWQKEFPHMADNEEETLASICREHPDNSWCKRFKGRDAHFR